MEIDKKIHEIDLLHPFASLKWRECRGPPVDIGDADAVWLNDKVYIGGGATSESFRYAARLYIYTPATDEWTTLDTPVCWFGLTTYHSQLVLVGGREYVGPNVLGEATNKLWTLSEDDQWQETLPPTGPMPTPCANASAVSYGDHLLVITNGIPNEVYVYNGHHWASAQPPPQQLNSIKSTIFNGHLYLMGIILHKSQKTCVYSASLDSLLASCQPSEISQPSSLWKRLTDVPSEWCCPAVFGNRLVAVEGSSSLYAYLSLTSTQAWKYMGDTPPIPIYSAPCAVPLPFNELMIINEWTAFRSKLTLTPFDPESPFTLRAVSLLESAAGIPVMTTLTDHTHHIQSILGLSMTISLDLDGVFKYWISGKEWLPPSWRNLLRIIRFLDQDELAQRMETYLSARATEELSPTRGKQGDEEVDEQIRLRDDVIFQLKQQMATQQQKIADLEYTNKELEESSQIPIEEKEDDQKDTKPGIPGVMTQLKEEPLTLEKERGVKREVKEEAVLTTKAEATSAQPTTATWNLRGVEVCGETTVVVYSSHGQQITWPGYGLRLNIPKGCLPAGMEQCTINIKASLAGQYEFPESSHLVSAIFWLRCEDVRKFTKLITVEIQHCAKSENITNLSFVRAVCSQKQLPYTFKQLPGGNFTSHSSYGVIELNSFSGVAVTQEGSEDREYCSRIFYMPSSHKIPVNREIHFVVTWNEETHLTVINNEYNEKGALAGPHQPVEFEADSISLDIPLEGLSIKGWEITPLMRPVVTKKQVDNFREGKLTPCCQLLAEISEDKEKVPTLKHPVNLRGAKYPNDVFVIKLPAGDAWRLQVTSRDLNAGPPPIKKSRSDSTLSSDLSLSQMSYQTDSTTNTPVATGLDTKLNLNSDHFKVAQYLQNLDEDHISTVGGALGLSYSKLRKMTKYPDDMVAAWLRREEFVSGEPTWRSLAEALRRVGQEGIASDIEADYRV